MSESIRAKMAKGEANLDQERLKQVIAYCPDTGAFTWLRTGSAAGSIDGRGYLLICVDGRKYRAHRLAWLYAHGRWPSKFIDHINGVKNDNRLCNLRDVTWSENRQNETKARKNSLTGFLGVTYSKPKKPLAKHYAARIYIDKKLRSLGYYATAEEAHEAYLEAKRKHHAGCTL